MKRLIQFVTTVGFLLQAVAVEVTVQEAGRAVDNWLGTDPALGCPLGRVACDYRTCQSPGGVRFHVVRLEGGGFVVMSADTTQEPVVAFSSDGDLIEDERNPLWVLLCRDFDSRSPKKLAKTVSAVRSLQSAPQSATEQKWARLLAMNAVPRKVMRLALAARTSVSDVRVAPFVRSAWGQTTAGGSNCYNLLTPKNYYVGCVATAGAQIMRYFEWPQTSVPSFTNAFCAVDGETVTLSAEGGVYDWANMPLEPNAGTPEDERLAIAGLMRDLGVACGMHYASSGSATGSYMLSRAWTTYFGYASAMAYTLPGNLPDEAVRRALISNFDARMPVEIGISGSGDGHAVVGDGYGYSDGTLYYHLNMGWEGNSNAWYAPPNLDAGGYSFNAIGSLVYNIFPNRSAGHTICSGRVLTAEGLPIPGATVCATDFWGKCCAEVTTDERGIYALILESTWVYPLPYDIHAEYDGKSAGRSVKVKMCISTLVSADGTFNSDTAPAPAVNNLIDQDLTIYGVPGDDEPDVPPIDDPPTDDPPSGDDFARPIQISGASGSHQIDDTSSFTKEDGEPIHSLVNGKYLPEARSAWYAWIAPGDGEVTFTVRSCKKVNGTTYFLHAMIAAYRGDDIRSAERIALYDKFNEDDTTSVTFAVTHGERYRLVVFAYADDPCAGPYWLSWNGDLATVHETQTTEVPVPFAWLTARYPGTADFESLASSTGANGRPVWESYLLGLEPTNSLSDLRITRFEVKDGLPSFGWNVTNENIRDLGYDYRIKGKVRLEDPWCAQDAAHRFFRLFVEKW